MSWKKLGHIGFLMLMLIISTVWTSYGGTAPTADFSVDPTTPVVTGQTITFTDNSDNNDGSINNRSWNFGNGAIHSVTGTNTATGIGPHFVYYNSAGTKTAQLIITYPGESGLFGFRAGSDPISKPITVSCNNPTPTISPDPASVVYGDTFSLNGNPTGGSGTYSTHLWEGSGATYLSATNTPTPNFSGAPVGSYNLTYTVTDSYGCVGTDDITITVTKATLTFTAGDQTVTYGTHTGTITQNGTYTISGYVNGDNSSVVTGLGSVSYTSTYTSTTNVSASPASITPVVTGLSSANYNLVAVPGNIIIAKADQFISCDCVPFTKPLNEFDTIPVGAVASSGLPVSMTILDGSAADLNGDIGNYYLTNIGTTGTVTLYADQAGNANYNPAATATRIFDVTKSNQNISFPDIDDLNYYNGLTLDLQATATSGLAISYVVVSGPATLFGNTLSINGIGEVKVMASQAGDASFNAAPSVIKTFNVLKGTQTITISVQSGALTSSTQITGTSTSGLPVALSLGAGSAATSLVFNSGGGYYTLTGIGGSGSIFIVGNQTGNAKFSQAPQVIYEIIIGKTNQTITFPAIANKTFGDSPFNLGATTTSPLTVSYTVTSGSATVSGSTLTITGAGTVTVAANQAGNGTYNTAPTVTRQFEAGKAAGVITQSAITATFGDAPIPINPSSNSNGTISLISGNNDIFSLSGSSATIVGAGTTSLYMTLQPTTNYLGASQLVAFTVNKANSAITVAGATTYTYNNDHQAPDGSTVTGSTGAVTFSYSGIGTTTYGPNFMKPTNAGTYSATATVAADDNYNSATSVPYDFSISKANPTIVVTPYNVDYDGTAHTATGTAKGVSGENLDGLNLSATTQTNAGDYNDSWVFTDETGNYNNATGNVNNTINKIPLDITADDAAKCFGDALTFAGTEFTSSGLISGETINSVSLASNGAPAAAASGPYPITAEGASGGTFTPDNYTINYIIGSLLVNPLPTLGSVTQAAAVCEGGSATILLDGLLTEVKAYTVNYTIDGTGYSANVTSTVAGEASFTMDQSAIADPSSTLEITGLLVTNETPGCTQTFTGKSVSLIVNPLPTLTGASLLSPVCNGSAATIKLTGLTAGSSYAIGYTIDGGSQLSASGLVVDGSGNSSFKTGVLTTANNGEILNIFGIQDETSNCAESYNYDVTLQVDPTSVAGSVSSDQNICNGDSPADISLTGSVGNIQWQSSTDNLNWTAVSGATGTTLSSAQMGTLTDTTYYRVQVTSGACTSVYSSAVTVRVEPTPVAGTLTKTPNTAAVCDGENVSASLTTGSGGNGTDELQFSIDGGTWSAYTSGTNISTTGHNQVQIRTRRLADYCTDSGYEVVSWLINESSIINLSQNSIALCFGDNLAVFGYTITSGSPNKYSIDFDNDAETAGFVDVVDADLSGGTVSVTLPATATPATYNSILSVTNSTTGCTSENYSITIVVNPVPATGEIISD